MTDVAIIGGGPVGATLALGLAGSGLRVKVLEARRAPEIPKDPRAIALSEGSRLILQRLGVWEGLAASTTPIRTIHVSQKHRFGRTVLRADESGRDALGYVVGYTELASAIDTALNASGSEIQRGAQVTGVGPQEGACRVDFAIEDAPQSLQVPLAVVADGGRSLASVPGLSRQVRDYGQHALVARVESEQPHGGIAYERFTAEGPVALLPWGERAFALVWTVTPELAATLTDLDADTFLARFHAHFGDRVGRFLAVSGRAAFPLKMAWVRPATAPHLALIGNAAQTLHPVAGQGFNLGLRDAWELARLIRGAQAADLGSAAMLAKYRAGRRLDTGGGMLFTDFLVRAFSNDWQGLGTVRGLGLAALDLCGPARAFISRKMSLGARG